VFSPGNPSAFQANYCAGQALLEQLEALAPSRAAVDRLRASSAAAGWAKRWNLPVYFSLVFQDIAGALLLLLLHRLACLDDKQRLAACAQRLAHTKFADG
jgi:hypothetical protein